jgi:rod shape-determining protein MreC
MNNLVEFIKKYFHYLLFIILQITSIILIYNNINYPRFVIAKISKTITTPFNSGWNNLTRHLNLNKENEYLMQQNIKLMRETKNNFIFQQDSLFTVDSINDRSKKIRLYDYTFANVIYNTTNKKHNYLILDKGSNDGITIDMLSFQHKGL